MEKKLHAELVRLAVKGRFDIIKSNVHRFFGKYSIFEDNELPPELAQSDALFSIDNENYIVHPHGLQRVERFLTRIKQEQVQLEVKVIRNDRRAWHLNAERVVQDVYPDANENNLLRQGKRTFLHVQQLASVANFDINGAVHIDITERRIAGGAS
jgi:hypothetical protein